MENLNDYNFALTLWVGDAKVFRKEGNLIYCPQYLIDSALASSYFTKVTIELKDKIIQYDTNPTAVTVLQR